MLMMIEAYILQRQNQKLCYSTVRRMVDVNTDKTKYMVMSRDQNAGRSHNIKSDNTSFEKMEEFKYLGTTLTYQNSIQEEIKSK